MRRLILSLVFGLFAGLTVMPSANAAPAPVVANAAAPSGVQSNTVAAGPGSLGSIRNSGSSYGSLGVIHYWDGQYAKGNYDALLARNTNTSTAFGWDAADGYYIGYGYSSAVDYWNGSRWTFYGNFGACGPAYTAGLQVHLARGYNWLVTFYPCSLAP